MRRILVVVGLIGLLTIAILFSRPTVADDFGTCRDGSGDVAISACTRAIESGKFGERELIVLLQNRAAEYKYKGDSARASSDLRAAEVISFQHSVRAPPLRWDGVSPSKSQVPAT